MAVFDLDEFERDLRSKMADGIHGTLVSVATVAMEPGPPDFITCRWLFDEQPSKGERATTIAYGRLRLSEWWLPGSLGIKTLLDVLRGTTPLEGVTFRPGPVVGERFTLVDRTYSGWTEHRYETRHQAERRDRGGVLRLPASTSGLRPYESGAHAVADFVWGDERHVSGGDAPHNEVLIAIVPDRRARFLDVDIADQRATVKVEVRARGVELQPLAHTASGARSLENHIVSVGSATEVGLALPPDTKSLGLYLVQGDDHLAEMRVTHPDLLARDDQTPLPREREQKFGILDAPKLFAADIADAFGALGAAVVYLDIDHFKVLNTQHTETVLDKTLLPEFQRLIGDVTLGHGFAYREGGDEFVLLPWNCTLAMAEAFVRDMVERVRAARFDVRGQTVSLTISAGVATLASVEAANDAKEQANLAKKHAKETGRDRASVWTSSGPRAVAVRRRGLNVWQRLLGAREG